MLAALTSQLRCFNRTVLSEAETTLTNEHGETFVERRDEDTGAFVVGGRVPLAQGGGGERKDMSYLAPPADVVDTSPCPRFDCNDPRMLAHLHEHGYVVVRGAANTEEVLEAQDSFWDFLESRLGWLREDPSTWTDVRMTKCGMPHNGIINQGGIGQSRLAWQIRCLPRVQEAFRRVWGVLPGLEAAEAAEAAGAAGAAEAVEAADAVDLDMDLLSSFDGANVFRPWHRHTAKGTTAWKTTSGWTHLDQGKMRLGLQCIQGLVTLRDASAATGGLVVVPGSHKRHARVLEAHATNAADYL